MKKQPIENYGVLAAVVGMAFAALSAWPIMTEGYFGFIKVHTQGPWGYQVIADLLIALSLFLIWMIRDARQHKLPAWPFVLAVLVSGSIGALAYVAVRAWREAEGIEART